MIIIVTFLLYYLGIYDLQEYTRAIWLLFIKSRVNINMLFS